LSISELWAVNVTTVTRLYCRHCYSNMLVILKQSCFCLILSPVHTVADKWDCRTKVRLSQKTARKRRQSHFCTSVSFFCDATVAFFCDSVDRALLL